MKKNDKEITIERKISVNGGYDYIIKRNEKILFRTNIKENGGNCKLKTISQLQPLISFLKDSYNDESDKKKITNALIKHRFQLFGTTHGDNFEVLNKYFDLAYANLTPVGYGMELEHYNYYQLHFCIKGPSFSNYNNKDVNTESIMPKIHAKSNKLELSQAINDKRIKTYNGLIKRLKSIQ